VSNYLAQHSVPSLKCLQAKPHRYNGTSSVVIMSSV